VWRDSDLWPAIRYERRAGIHEAFLRMRFRADQQGRNRRGVLEAFLPQARTLDPPGLPSDCSAWVAKNYSFGSFDLSLATLA